MSSTIKTALPDFDGDDTTAPSFQPPPAPKGQALPDKEEIKREFLDSLFYVQGKFPALATRHDYYMALAYLVRDHLLHRWVSTAATYTAQKARTVCYLSAEFLLGPHLGNNLINLGLHDVVKQAIDELGLNFEELLREEDEPGLGNGGLGRLAACYLDSLATLNIPTLGYGIRYEFGIFEQGIVDGWQVDSAYRDPDHWARMSILNVARSGLFSSDRAIREYARDIWKVEPVDISLLRQHRLVAQPVKIQ